MYKPVSKKTQSKVSCKYALSSVVAKRARMLVDLKECNEEIDRIEKKVLLLNESGETNEF